MWTGDRDNIRYILSENETGYTCEQDGRADISIQRKAASDSRQQ
jgi:hypothetical protein